MMGRTLAHLKDAMAGLSKEKDEQERKYQAILKHISDRVCLGAVKENVLGKMISIRPTVMVTMFATAEANGVI